MNDPITLAQEFHRTPPPAPLQHTTPQETHPWNHTPPSQLPDTVDELFKTSTLLTPEQQEQLVRQAHLPHLVDTPGAGTTECRTADGRTMHVYLPPPPTPTPGTANPLIDKWVVNTSALSLALSSAAFITAHAAATFVAALQAIAWFALATAIALGLIIITTKHATRPQPHIKQDITNHINSQGAFARARIDTPTTLTTGDHRE